MNILTQNFDTAYHTAPFEQIKNEDYLPAFKQLIGDSEKEINDIVNNPEAPTFSNTIEALAYSGEKLDVVSNIFFNLNSAETSDELQQIAQEVSPLLTEYSSKISQNEALFNRIKKVYDDKSKYNLNEEQQMLLDETYKGFVRSGALLNDADNLDELYKGLRWKNWREDTSKLNGDKVFNFYPFLWTKEGKNIENDSRKAISVEEQYHLNIDFKKQLSK
ncbi:DUF2625 family protein [Soonwooa sp.]|uniref:DUF2625 family protein n=1 Tax=Soonwooa sp. TaxID=1938592 RepID=UPI00260BD27E|nr:DUF2625 family protein [Soonwooa sp.]